MAEWVGTVVYWIAKMSDRMETTRLPYTEWGSGMAALDGKVSTISRKS